MAQRYPYYDLERRILVAFMILTVLATFAILSLADLATGDGGLTLEFSDSKLAEILKPLT